jgi:N-acetylglucosaminyldiphosphoundecaprenol N-acetyl-beta-D-mannosaminyltransferase
MSRELAHPIAVLGLPLDSLTVAEAVEAVEGLIVSGQTHQVATANLDFWLNSVADPHLHRILAGCGLVLPDGMPLVWASKLLGCPLAERVTGVDLVPRLAELSARKGYRIFLLGGREGVAERAAKLLESTYPGACIAGVYAPEEKLLAMMDHGEILNRIHAAKPDILLVAFGNPKQEKWIWMHRKRLGVPVAMGVGGSFEILVGDMRRAPRWVQRYGLEWLMRALQEPWRLIPRYVRDFVGLGRRLPMALVAAWTQRPYFGRSTVTSVDTAEAMHVYVQGKLTLEATPALEQAVRLSLVKGLAVVLHLQAVRQMNAAGVGYLLEARRRLLEAGLSLSLAGLSLKMRFLLRAWCVQTLFDEWQPAGAPGALAALESERLQELETVSVIGLSGAAVRWPVCGPWPFAA